MRRDHHDVLTAMREQHDARKAMPGYSLTEEKRDIRRIAAFAAGDWEELARMARQSQSDAWLQISSDGA